MIQAARRLGGKTGSGEEVGFHVSPAEKIAETDAVSPGVWKCGFANGCGGGEFLDPIKLTQCMFFFFFFLSLLGFDGN
jgi:hypothetical protein